MLCVILETEKDGKLRFDSILILTRIVSAVSNYVQLAQLDERTQLDMYIVHVSVFYRVTWINSIWIRQTPSILRASIMCIIHLHNCRHVRTWRRVPTAHTFGKAYQIRIIERMVVVGVWCGARGRSSVWGVSNRKSALPLWHPIKYSYSLYWAPVAHGATQSKYNSNTNSMLDIIT